MEHCPKCQSKKVHRSRTRNAFERIRRRVTGKAPFRCPDCGWRGWAFDFGSTGDAAGGRAPDGPEPDLGAVDRALSREKAE